MHVPFAPYAEEIIVLRWLVNSVSHGTTFTIDWLFDIINHAWVECGHWCLNTETETNTLAYTLTDEFMLYPSIHDAYDYHNTYFNLINTNDSFCSCQIDSWSK